MNNLKVGDTYKTHYVKDLFFETPTLELKLEKEDTDNYYFIDVMDNSKFSLKKENIDDFIFNESSESFDISHVRDLIKLHALSSLDEVVSNLPVSKDLVTLYKNSISVLFNLAYFNTSFSLNATVPDFLNNLTVKIIGDKTLETGDNFDSATSLTIAIFSEMYNINKKLFEKTVKRLPFENEVVQKLEILTQDISESLLRVIKDSLGLKYLKKIELTIED